MTRRLRNEKTAWDVNPRHLEILREHLPLFLKHAQAILANPRMFDSPVACAAIGGIYIGGINDLTLGGLLAAWEQGLLRCPCPRCGDTLYIHILVGSPLSGGHALRGVCTACRQAVSGTFPRTRRSLRSCFRPYAFYEDALLAVLSLILSSRYCDLSICRTA